MVFEFPLWLKLGYAGPQPFRFITTFKFRLPIAKVIFYTDFGKVGMIQDWERKEGG